MSRMDYDTLDQAYFDRFGDWFPNMSFMADSDEEIMQKMKDCLDRNTSAEELYNLSYADNIKY